MEKITKKLFIEALTEQKSVLALSKFRWNDDACISFMEKVLKINEGANLRTATKKGNSLVFSDESRLDFSQYGEKSYYTYKNNNGLVFYIQKTIVYDGFDGVNHQNYVVYTVA